MFCVFYFSVEVAFSWMIGLKAARFLWLISQYFRRQTLVFFVDLFLGRAFQAVIPQCYECVGVDQIKRVLIKPFDSCHSLTWTVLAEYSGVDTLCDRTAVENCIPSFLRPGECCMCDGHTSSQNSQKYELIKPFNSYISRHKVKRRMQYLAETGFFVCWEIHAHLSQSRSVKYMKFTLSSISIPRYVLLKPFHSYCRSPETKLVGGSNIQQWFFYLQKYASPISGQVNALNPHYY